eukprot:618953-Alexandrium_andersonii.AAC.1
MSASLVGSEMCIRDRRPIERNGGAAGAAGHALRRGSPCGGAHHLWGPCACLLYTSDAADDM